MEVTTTKGRRLRKERLHMEGLPAVMNPSRTTPYKRGPYRRFKPYRAPKPLEERFWAQVQKGEKPGECWIWTGARHAFGHGTISRGKGLGEALAHRLSWELANGQPVPEGMFIIHSCDVPPCVNPAHLRPGTQQDNVRDMDSRGRRNPQRGEAHHHAKLTENDIIDIRTLKAFGARQCDLAVAFGVGNTAITLILQHKSWKHAP